MGNSKKIVVVLGMHRSGTSAITQGLSVLKVDLGNNLMPAIPGNNDTGFWEDIDINSLNEELLKKLQSHWHGTRILDKGVLLNSQFLSEHDRAVDLLKEKIRPSDCFGFKDPRTVILLSFWQKVFAELKLEDCYLISLRNPLSVAESLSRRDGFDIEKSFLLWIKHFIAAIRNSEGKKRVVVDYDLLLNSPRAQLERVSKALKLPAPNKQRKELREYTREFLTKGLRHNTANMSDLKKNKAIPPFVRSAYFWLSKLARDEANFGSPAFKKAWRNIEETYHGFSALYGYLDQLDLEQEQLKAEQVRQISDLNQVVAERVGEISGLKQDLREQSRKSQEAKKSELGLSLELENAQKLLSENSGAHKALLKEFDERGEWAQGLSRELEQTRSNLNGLLESNSMRVTAPFRTIRRLAREFLKYNKNLIIAFLRAIYTRLPLSRNIKFELKFFAFQRFGYLFEDTQAYQIWCKMKQEQTSADSRNYQETPAFDKDLNGNFTFQKVLSPEVSIVIPVYGKIDYTYRCLKSVYEIPINFSYEIIVVDDCSKDNSFEVLSQIEGIRLAKNKQNFGFIRSCNKGASLARGKYIVFLNNDTQVLPHWLDELVKTFEAHPEAGLVGSKLIYPSEKLQEAGGIIWSDGTGWNYGRNQDPKLPEFNYLREVDYCSGASIMIPKIIFDELQGFDEQYIPAYYEDTDLAFAIRSMGKKVFYQPLSQVIHFEGITSGTDINQGTKAYQEINRQKFVSKWNQVLPAYGNTGESPHIAANRYVTKRILVIDSCTPTPDKDSGSVDTFNFLKIFKSLGFAVTFIPADNFLRFGKYTTDLQRMGVQCLYAPYVTDVLSHLKNYGDLYDLVLLYRVDNTYAYIDDVREHCPNAKIIFDTVDLHHLREERQAKIEGSKSLAAKAMETKKKEIDLMKKADATIVLSEAERKMLLADHPGLSIYTISLTLEISNHVPSFSKRKEIMFVGGFQHMPNVDAVLNFVHSTWPLVKQRIPNLKFYVIGSEMPEQIRSISVEDVIIVGYVEDLSEYLNQCRLSVAPMRFGSGVKGKVGRSLSSGLPCVATSISAEGMNLRANHDVIIADTPEEIADGITQLYNNPELWNRLSKNGQETARKYYSLDEGRRRLIQLLTDLGIRTPKMCGDVKK